MLGARIPDKAIPAIEARGLVKTFGETVALDRLDLTVEAGELYGLIGPNASGKTTLIRILNGLLPATSGEARVLGEKPGSRRADMGYMPQDEALYADLSVEENLQFFAGLYGVDHARRIRDMLRFTRLDDRRHSVVSHLSGGTRRRASLACALIHRPRVLFLDEPTVGVDPLLRTEFWEHFRELAVEGTGILITTHHIEEARRCDRVGLLWRGRMLQEGTPTSLLEAAGTDSLEGAFLAFLKEAEAA